MNDRTYMDVGDIARFSNESPEIVVKNLKKMIEKGFSHRGIWIKKINALC